MLQATCQCDMTRV